MPEAFMVGSLRDVSEGESSREERSSVPLDFFGAAFAPACLGLEGNVASSAASRRSRSAFLAAASAAFAAAASLYGGIDVSRLRDRYSGGQVEWLPYFLAFDFAPFAHSASSCCAIFAPASACFCAAASAFC